VTGIRLLRHTEKGLAPEKEVKKMTKKLRKNVKANHSTVGSTSLSFKE
jgi:hypothetical protein